MADSIDNRVFVLILQHPQERREALSTAALICETLRRAKLVVGLSWPGLARVAGEPAEPKRWAVLHLGAARQTPAAERRPKWDPPRPARHCAARRNLEPGEDAVVAQSLAAEAAPPRARPASPGPARPAAPGTAARGAVDDRSGSACVAASRSRCASVRCAGRRARANDGSDVPAAENCLALGSREQRSRVGGERLARSREHVHHVAAVIDLDPNCIAYRGRNRELIHQPA